MRIAILVPSRERIQSRLDLINSIIKTSIDINSVTLYLGIDDDDPTREDAMKLSKSYSFVKIVEIHNNGRFLGLGKLWNICARESTEEIIAMIGDDMVFVNNWDSKIIDEFKPSNCPSDGLKMVYCYDGRHGAAIAVNAFVSRKYMDLTGYFMREEFKCDFIDLWLQQVFTALNRIKYRGDIHIEHRHWSFGKMPRDGVALKLRGNNHPAISQRLWVETKGERIKEAEMIGKKLEIPVDITKINERIPG